MAVATFPACHLSPAWLYSVFSSLDFDHDLDLDVDIDLDLDLHPCISPTQTGNLYPQVPPGIWTGHMGDMESGDIVSSDMRYNHGRWGLAGMLRLYELI